MGQKRTGLRERRCCWCWRLGVTSAAAVCSRRRLLLASLVAPEHRLDFGGSPLNFRVVQVDICGTIRLISMLVIWRTIARTISPWAGSVSPGAQPAKIIKDHTQYYVGLWEGIVRGSGCVGVAVHVEMGCYIIFMVI
jgi:hypothetical protein